MIENLVPIKLPPGYLNNGTPYLSKGRWYTGSLVRFFQNAMQPIGGWALRSLSGVAISGTPNAAVSWEMNNGTTWLAIGTTTGLYAISAAGVVYNILPINALFAAPPYVWQLDLFGSYLMATFNAPPISGPSNSAVNFYQWNGDPAAAAALTTGTLQDTGAFGASSVENAPQAVFGLVTTPERFLFLLRGESPTQIFGTTTFDTTPDYSNRRVYWASQESNFDFRPGSTNTAGSFDLSTDGTLMCGKASRGQTLLWTTTDLWTATYIGGDFVYSFAKAGGNCGIISHHAAVVLDTSAYWMGYNKFFCYDGFVKTIPCDVNDYVFGDFNISASSTVWAFANPEFSEVTWHYPSSNSSIANKYVTYNYTEDHWVFGSLDRATGVTRFALAVPPVPVLIDSQGHVYNHETGTGRGGSNNVFAESGPVELGDGDTVVRVQRIVPDDKTAGDVTASLYTSMYPDQPETLNGPYTLASPTSVRVTARQVRLRIQEAAANAWRVGVVRLGGIPGGRR